MSSEVHYRFEEINDSNNTLLTSLVGSIKLIITNYFNLWNK